MAGPFPPNWYQYEFPLPKVDGAPVPSQADYSPQNCAWLIEMFAQILGVDHTELILRYENNTPDNPYDDIFVAHPNDGLYLPEASLCRPESLEQIRYEQKAKKSKILKKFEKYSPRGLDENFLQYFQDSGCKGFFAVSFLLTPASFEDVSNFAGYLNGVLDTLSVDKINQPVYSHDGDATYISNTSPTGRIQINFNSLPEDAPDEYSSLTVRWVDLCIVGTGNLSLVSLNVPGATKEASYVMSTGYSYHQLTWAERNFTKGEINSAEFVYGLSPDPLNLPTKRLTAVELVAQSA